MTEQRRPSRQARMECAKWLHYCVGHLEWPKSAMDSLEELWWKYHDDHGELAPPGVEFPQPPRE